MINTRKIKGRLAEMELTQSDVANYLGISSPTVSLKLNNLRALSLEEAEKLSRLLKISNMEFRDYFFAQQVALCNKQTERKY